MKLCKSTFEYKDLFCCNLKLIIYQHNPIKGDVSTIGELNECIV